MHHRLRAAFYLVKAHCLITRLFIAVVLDFIMPLLYMPSVKLFYIVARCLVPFLKPLSAMLWFEGKLLSMRLLTVFVK